MRELDDDERREQLRRDPRRDPTEPPPPAEGDSEQRGAPSSEREEPPAQPPSDAKPEGEKKPAAPDRDDAHEPPSSRRRALPADVPPTAPTGGRVVTAADPRIAELEPLVATANWEAVLSALGSEEEAGKLPPNLGLIYAVAHKEYQIEKEDEAGNKDRDKSGYEPNAVAIRCMAGIFGVAPESPIALVLGKRLMRSNPVSWQKKKAPPASISVLIVALGLIIGAGIGWLLSFGYVEFKLPFLS